VLHVAKERVQIRMADFDAPTQARLVAFGTLFVRLWLSHTLGPSGPIERLQMQWRSTEAISC